MSGKTMLNFDYDEACGHTVTAVLGHGDGVERRWWTIAIQIGLRALILRTDADTDQISVSLETWPQQQDIQWEPVTALKSAVGAPLGWCWIGRNYRGYLDMFTVSFADLEPQFCFIGEASAIRIKQITSIS
jgi:hypothetical protein